MKLMDLIRYVLPWRTRKERQSAGEYRKERIEEAINSKLFENLLWRAHSQPNNIYAQRDLRIFTALLGDALNHPDVRYVVRDLTVFYDAMDKVEAKVKADVAARRAKKEAGR